MNADQIMLELDLKLSEAKQKARESGAKIITQVRISQSDFTTAEGRKKLKRDQIEQ
jgi:hypothetical protein